MIACNLLLLTVERNSVKTIFISQISARATTNLTVGKTCLMLTYFSPKIFLQPEVAVAGDVRVNPTKLPNGGKRREQPPNQTCPVKI